MKNQKSNYNERRVIANGDLRAITKGDKKIIYGYAALFAPAQTQDMGGWREEVSPNAFDRCLRSSPDVVALFNHSTDSLPLARTTSGTLRLSIDRRGLLYELDTPDTTLGRDLSVLLDRGDVHQSSYGFICRSESWRNDSDGTPIRTVLDADLMDVSPVIFPATLDTTSGVRKTALRNAPASIRKKLRDADDDPSDSTDPDAEDDGDGDDDDACGCDCDQCEDGDCENCSDPQCDEEQCADCPAQERAAHLEIIARKKLL
jgi:HK97 family phage prohead protease